MQRGRPAGAARVKKRRKIEASQEKVLREIATTEGVILAQQMNGNQQRTLTALLNMGYVRKLHSGALVPTLAGQEYLDGT